MSLRERMAELLHGERAPLALDDIQALILRSRPEPYVGIHAMLHVDDAAGGRDLVRRLTPHIRSAANWTEVMEAWTGVAFSCAGLKALRCRAVAAKLPPGLSTGYGGARSAVARFRD